MTVAMLLNPLNPGTQGGLVPVPFLAADCMSIRPGADGPRALPATVSSATANVPGPIRLVRKLYIFEGRAAAAFAGDDRVIRDVFDEIRAQVPIWLRSERPMERLETLVNEYDDIEVLGGSLDPERMIFNQIRPFRKRADLGVLGEGVVIGSGREQVLNYVRWFNEHSAVTTARLGEDLGKEFLSYVNGTHMANEITGFEATWGGYLEHAVPHGQGWVRGPSFLHFFFIGERLWGDDTDFHQLGRAIAYDPGPPHGRILTHVFGDASIEFLLEDLMHPIDREAPPDTVKYWSGWRPQTIQATVLLPDELRSRVCNLIVPLEMHGEVDLIVSENRARAAPSSALLEWIGQKAAIEWGRKYAPC